MFALTRRVPVTNGSLFAPFEQEIDRFFQDFARPMWVEAQALVPPADVVETADAIELRMDLPGHNEKDIAVTLEDGVLSVRAERKLEKEQKGEVYHRSELRYGAWQRSFALPTTVDVGAAKARYANGVLTIALPKREEAKPRSINIEVCGQ